MSNPNPTGGAPAGDDAAAAAAAAAAAGGGGGAAGDEAQSLADLAAASGKPDESKAGELKPGEGKPGEWFLADGVKGVGDPPPWYNAAKYKTVAAQAEAQRALEKRLGGYTGAPTNPDGTPKDYELTLPTDKDGNPTIQGEFDKDHPLLKAFTGIARESGMNQEAFTKALHAFAQWEAESGAVNLEHELAQLGENAQARVKDVTDWAKATLTPEEFQDYRFVTMTAGGFRLVERLASLSRAGGAAPRESLADSNPLDLEIELLLKPNDKGQRPIDVDQAALEKYRRLLRERHGDSQVQPTVVGG